LNSYGKVRKFQGKYVSDCPFRYQGQYEDKALGVNSPFPNEKEFAVINKISDGDIKAHVYTKDITDPNNIKWKCH
jgi:hypothetical protein